MHSRPHRPVRGLSRRPNFERRHYRLVSSHHARPSSARSDRLPSLVPCGFRRQVREPRAAGPREILPSLACGQRREDVGQGDVGPEPRLKPVTAQLLARPQRSQSMQTTSKGNSPIGCEPMRFIAARRPGSSISLACDLSARGLRSSRTGRPPPRDPQRRAIDMRPDQRPRMLFLANLLRFPAMSDGDAHRRLRLPRRRIPICEGWRYHAATR
jgi:hypothetical protein